MIHDFYLEQVNNDIFQWKYNSKLET